MGRGSGLIDYVKKTFREFGDDGGSSLAAAIAYYTAFSLPPLLVLLVWIAGVFLDPSDVQGRLAEQMQSLLGGNGAELVRDMIASASERTSGGGVEAIIGILALLFGATGAFIELQRALNRAWDVEPAPDSGGVRGFLMKRLASLGMVLAVAFLLLVSLALSAAISALGSWLGTILPWLNSVLLIIFDIVLSLILFTLLIGLIFKVLPDADLTFRDVRTGALVTAVLFIIGKFAIGFYLGQGNVGSVFGAAGSLAIILTWIYYSAIILLLGAEFTQVWVRKDGRIIEPEKGAVKVEKAVVGGEFVVRST